MKYVLLSPDYPSLFIQPDNHYDDYWGESSAISNKISLYYKKNIPIDINELTAFYVHEDTHIQQGVKALLRSSYSEEDDENDDKYFLDKDEIPQFARQTAFMFLNVGWLKEDLLDTKDLSAEDWCYKLYYTKYKKKFKTFRKYFNEYIEQYDEHAMQRIKDKIINLIEKQ